MSRLRTYSLRGLLIAVTIAGGLLAWATRDIRGYERRIAATTALESDVCMASDKQLPWYLLTIYRWRGLDPPRCFGRHICVHPSAKIDDGKAAHIAALRDLEKLSIYGELAITDQGLRELATLPHLHHVHLWHRNVTADVVERFRRALPACEIHWTPPTTPATAARPEATEDGSSVE